MVNYKIGISNKKESRIIEFEKRTDLKKLENLDKLTMSLKNEDELKAYLLKCELITLEELKHTLSIMYRNSGKVKKLPIFYSDMQKYLDEVFLRYELMSLSKNTEFLEKLARHYSIGSDKFNPQGLNVSDIRLYLSDVRSNGGNHFESKLLSTALEDLFIKAVYKINNNTGEAKINYRGLRDLGLFMFKFNTKLEKEQQKIEQTQNKKNNNESESDWAQISLFDIMNNDSNNTEIEETSKKWTLSSEGDPDFPPNSEEEANYKKYLEKLDEIADNEPIENHPHYGR